MWASRSRGCISAMCLSSTSRSAARTLSLAWSSRAMASGYLSSSSSLRAWPSRSPRSVLRRRASISEARACSSLMASPARRPKALENCCSALSRREKASSTLDDDMSSRPSASDALASSRSMGRRLSRDSSDPKRSARSTNFSRVRERREPSRALIVSALRPASPASRASRQPRNADFCLSTLSSRPSAKIRADCALLKASDSTRLALRSAASQASRELSNAASMSPESMSSPASFSFLRVSLSGFPSSATFCSSVSASPRMSRRRSFLARTEASTLFTAYARASL
ncbi:MAG: hypothetical protein A4E30_01569 [Methanomassiliicoccales archaeon PtaB.Bin215]|nr:MAG: hypothetical protein A4E30_01569 [Methanomassiliicoccales archaeon PtaB.Bin215]